MNVSVLCVARLFLIDIYMIVCYDMIILESCTNIDYRKSRVDILAVPANFVMDFLYVLCRKS